MPLSLLKNLSIVLVRPRFPENIGASARAALNMGVGEIRVVQPENFDLIRIHKMATHEAASFITDSSVYPDLKSALAPFQYVIGTTARLGGERKKILYPSIVVQKIMGLLPENNTALVFGSEDRGLENTEIRLCHELVHIPTAEFSSLNLAQAVMIMCYECFKAIHEKTPVSAFIPRLASHAELEGLHNDLVPLLTKSHYINPENPEFWMVKVRNFINRMELKAIEVNILRGICRQINWYAKKQYEVGKSEALSSLKESS